MKTISSFAGPHRFLSNFWPVCVIYDGHSYRSVEHAYQAAKTEIPSIREAVRRAPTAADAKKIGKTIAIRRGWNEMKVDLMLGLLRQKFEIEPLRRMLLRTGSAKLVEGNWWGDTFWGICNGEGQNMLGELLMKVRAELNSESDHA